VQFYDLKGKLLVGGKISTLEAGTTTLVSTYGDVDGTILQTNPIVLNDYGMPEFPVWLESGVLYKFVIYDANDNLLWTYDNIAGVNDPLELGKSFSSQWIEEGIPNYVSENSFYLTGDRTDIFHQFRRVKIAMVTGDIYGSIIKSEYNLTDDKTTITLLIDGGEELTEDLLLVYYGILSYAPQSYPNFLSMAQWQKRGDDLAIVAGKVNTWDTSGNFSHVTGTGEVADLSVAYQEGSSKYLLFDEAGVVIKNNAKIKPPRGVDLYLVAGDIIEVFGGKDGVNIVAQLTSNAPTVLPTWSAPLQVRQTVLTGPAGTQLGSSPSYPLVLLCPYMPAGTNALDGWTQWRQGGSTNYTGTPWTQLDRNGGTWWGLADNTEYHLDFPRYYYVTSISISTDGYAGYFYIHYEKKGWVNVWNGGGSVTYNTDVSDKINGFYMFSDPGGGNYKAYYEVSVYGYEASDISAIATVTAVTETLLFNTPYVKSSPVMTSYNENGYIVSASTESGTNYAWKGFSGNTTSFWEANTNTNAWLRMQFPLAIAIGRLVMQSPATNVNEMPVSFRIEGSQDGIAWDILGSWINGPVWVASETKNFDFNNSTAYLYYRVYCLTNGGGSKIAIGECSFNSLQPGSIFGTCRLNLSDKQAVITFANGFGTEGQVDYTIALPKNNETCVILPASINYIYIRRDPVSGGISYESKQFAPIYGLYQPSYNQTLPTLLRGNGTSGSASIVDSYGATVAVNGTVTNSSTQFKFGAGSILFGSAGSYLSIPKNFGIARERWSVDFWWQPTSLTGIVDLFTAVPGFSLILSYGRTATKLSIYLSSNGTTWDIATNSAGLKTNFAIGTWYYINMTFLGRRYMVFVDGVKDIEVASTSLINQVTSITVGGRSGENNTACGFIDDFRFRPGMGDYYSEPTATIPTSEATFVKPWYFNINEMKGYEREEDGTSTSVQLLCVGEALTREITSYDATVTTYAYNGRKNISWTSFDPVVDDWLVLPHNMGTDLITPNVSLNSATAGSPYNAQAILPIDGVGMYNAAAWGGIPMARIIDSKSYKIRYPAQSSTDYVASYSGSGAIANISGAAINISATFLRAF
jgi:hypothetical protein